MTRKQFLTLHLLATVGFAPLVGCGRRAAPLAIEIGFDVTPPKVEERAKRASQFVKYLRRGDAVTVRALDNETTILATTTPRTDQDAYRTFMDAAGRMTPVTNLPRYFEQILPAVEGGHLPTVVCVYTDGLTDACTPDQCKRRIRAVAERLAKNERLKAVVLIGTVRESRPRWAGLPEMLDPLRGKLTVYPRTMVDSSQVMRQVRAIRQSVAPRKGG